ncbi:MAG: methyltransferase domain-containing protein [Chloroflexia bacterium]
MSPKKAERILDYQGAYLADYGFEGVMVAARQRMIIEVLSSKRPEVVVEIGCGTDPLSRRVADAGISVKRWIVVEPAPEFAKSARATARADMPLTVVDGFLEDVVDDVRAQIGLAPPFVVCASLLHEVPDAQNLLAGLRRLVDGGGLVHLNVPNARSLHRRLARAMGLIRSEHQLSDRNRALQQPRVFDSVSLASEIVAAGFDIEDSGGYFLKPFTHRQMESIVPIVGGEVLSGLWDMGRELPELASEIFVHARPSP